MRFFLIFGVFFLSFLYLNADAQHSPPQITVKQLKNGFSYSFQPLKDKEVELIVFYPQEKANEIQKMQDELLAAVQSRAERDSVLCFLAKNIKWEMDESVISYSLNLPSLNEENIKSAVQLYSLFFNQEEDFDDSSSFKDAYEEIYSLENACMNIKQEIDESWIEEPLEQYFSCFSSANIACKEESVFEEIKTSLAKGNLLQTIIAEDSKSNEKQVQLFYNLFLSEADKDHIAKLVKKLAHRSVFELLWHKKEMQKLGNKIEHVHPLRFIGYIYSRADLKKDLREVRDSSFKWTAFVDGFAGGMEKSEKKNNLLPYIPGFCNSLGVKEEDINGYVHKRDWEGLLKHFL